jgi:hypothetical protein
LELEITTSSSQRRTSNKGIYVPISNSRLEYFFGGNFGKQKQSGEHHQKHMEIWKTAFNISSIEGKFVFCFLKKRN